MVQPAPAGAVSAGILAAATWSATLLLAPPAAAQNAAELRYSLDFQGPLMGVPNPAGVPTTDADLLVREGPPFAPQQPRIVLTGQFLDQYGACAGHAPGVACGLEINAISFGRDARLRPGRGYQFSVYLSVDEFAVGRPPITPTTLPTIFSEALEEEAAGDVYVSRFMGPGPYPNLTGSSFGVADGDGDPSSPQANSLVGLGLIEPIVPNPGVPETGSNLDAIDLGPPLDPAGDVLFFSLEGGIPRCNEPLAPVFDAAALQSLVSGGTARSADILFVGPGGQVDLYADASELGLDLFGGDRSDDIDAIAVVENGTPGYQPPDAPYSWLGPNPTDLVLFSLRCGSATLGQPDAFTGLPMTEGDVLVFFAGGQRPGIWIPAEALGLETIARGGMANDDLVGLDTLDDGGEPFKDCNGNGVEDLVDILNGTSSDCDGNGVPDECEKPGIEVCDCSAAVNAACGNTAGSGEGCENNVGLGGRLMGGGTSSIETDALELVVSQVTPNTFGIIVVGAANTSVTVGNGRLCLGAFGGVPNTPVRLAVEPTGASGAFTYGPGVLADVGASPAGSVVSIGSSIGFQLWYRDVGGPCGQPSNWTNALLVLLTP
ncbi:MAG: hypothetical protein AAGB93_22290 [Planctomycetota bacterium]